MPNRPAIVVMGLLIVILFLGGRLLGANRSPSPPSSQPNGETRHPVEPGGEADLAGQYTTVPSDSSPPDGVPKATCVDGSDEKRPFTDVECIETVETLSEAAENLSPGSLVVVRSFPSEDSDSIRGVGTYRGRGLQGRVLTATAANPIIIQAEGFDPDGDFDRPILEGARRVHGTWSPTPGTEHTWQIPFDRLAEGFIHWACVDRIWVSRLPGKRELADFPLTRPIMKQGGVYPHYSDCEDNTDRGAPITPQVVDGFPGSYYWLDGMLYVHMPGNEDPNGYTVEVPYYHPLSQFEDAAGLIIRGFRVYHSLLGIDLYSCGTSAADRCEASHNDASFNFPFGLQTGPYSYLHHNTGTLNTIQLIKITQDFSEISYNEAGPQLSHGFKLLEVRDCIVHHNEVFGNNLPVPEEGTQADWSIIGTRDITAGILLNPGTQDCELSSNLVHENRVGFYVQEDQNQPVEGNLIQQNHILHNRFAIKWRGSSTWGNNLSNNNQFSSGAMFEWSGESGPFEDYVQATRLDTDSLLVNEPDS